MKSGLQLCRNSEFQLDLPNGTTVKGRIGEAVEDTELGYSVRIGAVDARPGRQFTLVQQSEERSISDVEKALTVTELGREHSGILELRLTSPNSYDARRILDAITRNHT